MEDFSQQIREQNKSLILTIPSNVVKSIGLKNKDFCKVIIKPRNLKEIKITKNNKKEIHKFIKSVLDDVKQIRAINNQLILTLTPKIKVTDLM